MKDLISLREDLSARCKNGIDFISSAVIMWAVISFIWTLELSDHYKCILTFFTSGLMFPLALLFSKVYKTEWKIKDNALHFGLWLNISQLFYFPLLVYAFLHTKEHFVFFYIVITGAHFFPFSWLYRTPWYAMVAGVSVLGATLGYRTLSPSMLAGLFGICLLVLVVLLSRDRKVKSS
jgi:hypothetical protein